MAAYDEALTELARAPAGSFLAERKRLAAELRARGDAAGAAELAKRRKPTASVWVVNDLYWRAREAFDAMLEAAARLRKGDLGATQPYHDSVADLRNRAVVTLKEAGHGGGDATLRRVTATLAAIAAAGGFDPDPPGALSADRDPPGFDAIDPSAVLVREERAGSRSDVEREPRSADDGGHRDRARSSDHAERARAEREARAAEEAERKLQEAERARRSAERRRLRAELREATSELKARELALALLEEQRGAAVKAVADAREAMSELTRMLTQLAEEG